jgi:hypothetical protein
MYKRPTRRFRRSSRSTRFRKSHRSSRKIGGHSRFAKRSSKRSRGSSRRVKHARRSTVVSQVGGYRLGPKARRIRSVPTKFQNRVFDTIVGLRTLIFDYEIVDTLVGFGGKQWGTDVAMDYVDYNRLTNDVSAYYNNSVVNFATSADLNIDLLQCVSSVTFLNGANSAVKGEFYWATPCCDIPAGSPTILALLPYLNQHG